MQVWVNNSQLPGDHAVAGSFETAARVGGRPLMFWNTHNISVPYHTMKLACCYLYIIQVHTCTRFYEVDDTTLV